jgi:hypothetical protein
MSGKADTTQQTQTPPEGTDPNVVTVPVQPTNGNGQQAPAPSNWSAQFSPEQEALVQQRIEQARAEEKDKLYGRIGGLTTQVNQLQETLQQREAREQAEREEAQRLASEEAERKAREEMDAKTLVETVEQRFAKQLEQIQLDAQKEIALLRKDNEFERIQRMRAEALASPEVQNSILPELLDEVRGTTPEEIAASIAHYQQRSAAILASIAERDQQMQQQQQAQGQLPPWQLPRNMPSSITAPNAGPETQTQYETMTLDDISNMPMDIYAQNRERLKAAVSRSRPQGGGPLPRSY